jgi:hypothetical protein
MTPAHTIGASQPMTSVIVTYFYLQGLDLLTTIAFLLAGVDEGNPIVRFAMQTTSHPLLGLLAVKFFAVGLGLYCWFGGRHRLVLRVNYAYGTLIAWNLVCLVLAMIQAA